MLIFARTGDILRALLNLHPGEITTYSNVYTHIAENVTC